MLTPKQTEKACLKLAERFECSYLELMDKLDSLTLPEAIVLNQTTQVQINKAAMDSQQSDHS